MLRVTAAATTSVSGTTTGGSLYTASTKDRQLIFMLLMDMTIYGLFSFMFAIFLIYQQITQDYIKTMERIQIENVFRNLCLFSIDISICISCYANLIVSKTFRKEVKKTLSWKRIFCIH